MVNLIVDGEICGGGDESLPMMEELKGKVKN